jgi:hypothetical protein
MAKIQPRDVDLFLKIVQTYNTDIDFKATCWFWGEFKEKTFEEFRARYPDGSMGFQYFEKFTSKLDMVGLLAAKGLLNEDLWFEKYGTEWAEWEKARPVIYGLREAWGEPGYRQYFEWLVNEGQKWKKKGKKRGSG